MENIEERTVGQIVAADYRAAKIFKDYNIDFCCGGEKTLDKACSNKNIQVGDVVSALEDLSESGNEEDRFNNWGLGLLADYITQNHHAFTRKKIPEISAYGETVAKVHGENHEELYEIYEEFLKLSEEMTAHMQEEEEQLFPYIKQLAAGKQHEGEDGKRSHSAELFTMMQHEHDEAGDSLKRIRQLSRDYTLPEDACTTYQVYFKNLEGFEKDMHKHVHLENNILFPKAIKLGKN
jgi:regulator of cell morphogenesis and NO signaling